MRSNPATSAGLVAVVQGPGGMGPLLLRDSQGRRVIQSQGVSSSSGNVAIDEQLTFGEYTLSAASPGGPYATWWTIMLRPGTAPFQPIPVGSSPAAIVTGDFDGDGRPDLALTDARDDTVSVLLGNGDGTFQPRLIQLVGALPERDGGGGPRRRRATRPRRR